MTTLRSGLRALVVVALAGLVMPAALAKPAAAVAATIP